MASKAFIPSHCCLLLQSSSSMSCSLRPGQEERFGSVSARLPVVLVGVLTSIPTDIYVVRFSKVSEHDIMMRYSLT